MNRASRLSGVELLFRLDNKDPLLMDAERDPDLKLLVPEGVLGDETLEGVFLRILLLEVELSDEEVTFFKEEVAFDDNDDFSTAFSAEPDLPCRDLADNLGTGAFGLIKGGRDVLLISLVFFFTVSGTGKAFFPLTPTPLSGFLRAIAALFSNNPPVLFLLGTETFELVLTAGFIKEDVSLTEFEFDKELLSGFLLIDAEIFSDVTFVFFEANDV